MEHQKIIDGDPKKILSIEELIHSNIGIIDQHFGIPLFTARSIYLEYNPEDSESFIRRHHYLHDLYTPRTPERKHSPYCLDNEQYWRSLLRDPNWKGAVLQHTLPVYLPTYKDGDFTELEPSQASSQITFKPKTFGNQTGLYITDNGEELIGGVTSPIVVCAIQLDDSFMSLLETPSRHLFVYDYHGDLHMRLPADANPFVIYVRRSQLEQRFLEQLKSD